MSAAAQAVSRHPRWRRRSRRGAAALAASVLGTVVLLAWANAHWPARVDLLDTVPTSTEVADRAGGTLARRIGPDGQVRQPVPLAEMGPWLPLAAVAAEDARFRSHPGVDPFAAVRAVGQLLAHGRVVSGASTITMQVCRMIEPRPRTLASKAIETLRALQLERCRDKDQLLEDWLNLIPVGGNVRGVEAGAQRWFGCRAQDLSLDEAALLVGLAQSPSRLRPDRHPERARMRRDWVLDRMLELGTIDARACRSARERAIALAEGSPSVAAPHAAALAIAVRPAGGRTTIDPDVQALLATVVAHDLDRLRALDPAIDVAAAVVDIDDCELVALVGSADPDDPRDGQVNGALAWRSPGSALKPFLYAAAFESGLLAPEDLLEDAPVDLSGWRPRNFDGGFDGRVAATDALRRSLNVPALHATQIAGLDRCVGTLQACGVRFLGSPERRGGLALAVGAVEVRLLDLVSAYATIGHGGRQQALRLFLDEPRRESAALKPDTCTTIEDLLGTHRRAARGLEGLAHPAWFMWKTGTSAGHRDAWALGENRRYAVGVWVGRFDGRAVAGLTGATAAEPLLAILLSDPLLRVDEPPPAVLAAASEPRDRAAARARTPSSDHGTRLRIAHPTANAVHVALDGVAAIGVEAVFDRPRRSPGADPAAQGDDRTWWFVNGLPVEPDAGGAIRLAPGRWEIRCADAAGRHDAVNVIVSGAGP